MTPRDIVQTDQNARESTQSRLDGQTYPITAEGGTEMAEKPKEKTWLDVQLEQIPKEELWEMYQKTKTELESLQRFCSGEIELGYKKYWELDKELAELRSRPTCGVEQRKFLDEIERDGKIGGENDDRIEVGDWTQIVPSDFTADLQKVIKGE